MAPTTKPSAANVHSVDPVRQAAGFKAAMHNPNVSVEGKEHAKEQLEAMQNHSESAATEHDARVLGGYKATLHNPRTSEAAKEHAAEVLKDAGAL